MSKCCVKKLVNKAGILSMILGTILAAALVIGLVFGFNGSMRIKDAKTLTVSINTYAYETKADDVERECEKAFGKLDYKYQVNGEMDGDECEIVYVFDKDVKDADLQAAKATLDGVFDTWEGSFVNVTVGSEKVVRVLPDGYVWKGLVAGGVFVALAFVYVALRYNLKTGAVTAIGTALGALLTAALLILTRIPVTASVAYVLAASALLAAVTTLLSFNKIRANKDGEVCENIAIKEICLLTVLLGGALILVGALATVSTRWFALAALIGTLVAAFVGMVYAPALYAVIKTKKGEEKPRSGYVGAKKKKEKTVVATEIGTEVATEVETPVEEPVQTPVVEEVPVEVAEETTESVEETETVETEEIPVEVAEEVAEESEEKKDEE